MWIVEILKRIFGRKNNKVQKKCCRTCRFNEEWYYCSHPKGNCYDSKDAETKWEPITKKGDDE